jgi:2-polyprenyl-6-methoxyphenol hydroxylase-like FAD-dependent oxidoreductase
MDTDVVIAGAGPNGLLTACELALAGVRTIVLERLAEPASSRRANGLVGRVVQALDQRGLYERFGGSGVPRPVPHFQFGALGLDMTELADNALCALPIPQRRMELALAERAKELGVEIRRGHEFVALGQDAEQVTVTVRTNAGPYELTARFLVGADGGHSPVRKACGIGFPGVTDRSSVSRSGRVVIPQPFAVPGTGELDIPGLGRLRPASFTRTENGLFAFGMFQPGVHLVSMLEWGEETPEREDWSWQSITLDELAASLHRVLGVEIPVTAPPEGPEGRRTTTTNSRQAERYRHGRVFLVGDAAHVQSSVGGPGLNLGLLDGMNLGWKLAAAVHGWAPPGLLDTYHAERHPVGERVIMASRAQTALIGPGPNVTALRRLFDELLRSPQNVRHISDLMSAADTRYDTVGGPTRHDLAGRWLPDLPLHTATGRTRVAEVLRAGRPVLLDLTGRDDLRAVAAGWAGRVDVLTATTPLPPADAVLVRPDGHVAWAGADDDGLGDALLTWFGDPVRPLDRSRVTPLRLGGRNVTLLQ